MNKSSLYFSDLLPVRFPDFFKELSGILNSSRVPWGLLPYTQDVWCRDYMPVQVAPGDYVQFRYTPSYLQTKKDRSTITDSAKTCRAIGIKPRVSDLVVDGGNVIRFGAKAIMTERVYRENPDYSKQAVKDFLTDLLKVRELILIPEEPGDPYGHADGCVRFVNKDTVIIHKMHKWESDFGRNLRKVLKGHGLECVELPYSIEIDPKHKDSAVGNYVNYLQVGNLVIVPGYAGHGRQNHLAVKTLSRVFSGKKVVQVESTPVAKEGGVLNCISWHRDN